MTIVCFCWFFFSLLCVQMARTLGYGQQTNFLEREPTNCVSPSLSLLRSIGLDRISQIQSVWRNVERQMCYFLLFIRFRLVINFQCTASPQRYAIFSIYMNRRPRPARDLESELVVEKSFSMPLHSLRRCHDRVCFSQNIEIDSNWTCKDPVAASNLFSVLSIYFFLTSYFIIRYECSEWTVVR